MGQAKQRGTYEQRKALAIALIKENTKAAAIEVKKLQAETEPRILMVEGGHNSKVVIAMAASLALTHTPLIANPPVPTHRLTRRRKGL